MYNKRYAHIINNSLWNLCYINVAVKSLWPQFAFSPILNLPPHLVLNPYYVNADKPVIDDTQNKHLHKN